MSPHKYKIELIGLTDCKELVESLEQAGKTAKLTDGNDFCVSAKSLLGALAALEWDELYIESEDEIYGLIQKWSR